MTEMRYTPRLTVSGHHSYTPRLTAAERTERRVELIEEGLWNDTDTELTRAIIRLCDELPRELGRQFERLISDLAQHIDDKDGEL